MSDDPEFEAMGDITTALGKLENELARGRVLRYVAERYGVVLAPPPRPPAGPKGSQNGGDEVPEQPDERGGAERGGERGGRAEVYSDIADLYDAASPTASADQVLVVAYWHQVCVGRPDFGGYEVNTSLKHLGHGVANITTVLTRLAERKPVHVMQIRKSGKSAQARKRYKLTREGILAVEKMIKARAEA